MANKVSRKFGSYTGSFYYRDLAITYNQNPGTPSFDPKYLAFGQNHTDHMASILFDGEKWLNPEIIPYQPIPIDPFNSTIHYGITCFEGMKAYYGVDDKIRMMRPWDNMNRLKSSMSRLAMDAPWEGEELLKILSE